MIEEPAVLLSQWWEGGMSRRKEVNWLFSSWNREHIIKKKSFRNKLLRWHLKQIEDIHTCLFSHKTLQELFGREGTNITPVHHWEPSFVFALFSPQRCKWRWEMARQESTLMTNTGAILGCVINVVQLYHSSFMTMHSTAHQAFPCRLRFEEGALARKVFSDTINGDFMTSQASILKPYLGKSRLLGTLKFVLGLSREPTVCACRNLLAPGRAETCFF